MARWLSFCSGETSCSHTHERKLQPYVWCLMQVSSNLKSLVAADHFDLDISKVMRQLEMNV